MRFKEGDLARRKIGTGDCGEYKEGKTYTVGYINGGLYLIGENIGGCSCWEKIELVPEIIALIRDFRNKGRIKNLR